MLINKMTLGAFDNRIDELPPGFWYAAQWPFAIDIYIGINRGQ